VKPTAIVFDLFGTLLNIASLHDAVARVTDDPTAFIVTWREKQIMYAFAGTIMQTYEDFEAMTRYGLQYAAAKYGVMIDQDEEHELLAAWETLQPYPEAGAVLRTLRESGIPCAVLTNGTRGTAERALAYAALTSSFDAVLSVDDVAAFKPQRRVYELVTDRFKTAPENVIFVTSNGWDATGAATFGMAVAWCNRFALPAETFGPPPRWTIDTLQALPGIVAQAKCRKVISR